MSNHKCDSTGLSPFYRCPPELRQRILAFACLDDGTTGRSLSLVYISDASKPFVYSLYQAEDLGSKLRKLSCSERRVAHLFVVCNYIPT